jgi:hypothetical protein
MKSEGSRTVNNSITISQIQQFTTMIKSVMPNSRSKNLNTKTKGQLQILQRKQLISFHDKVMKNSQTI